jgi:hypothetical protein
MSSNSTTVMYTYLEYDARNHSPKIYRRYGVVLVDHVARTFCAFLGFGPLLPSSVFKQDKLYSARKTQKIQVMRKAYQPHLSCAEGQNAYNFASKQVHGQPDVSLCPTFHPVHRTGFCVTAVYSVNCSQHTASPPRSRFAHSGFPYSRKNYCGHPPASQFNSISYSRSHLRSHTQRAQCLRAPRSTGTSISSTSYDTECRWTALTSV